MSSIYNMLIKDDAWLSILKGLGVTVKISFFALILGTLTGALICCMRRSKNILLRNFAKIYIAILRGSPVSMLLLLFYYGIFVQSPLDSTTVAVLAFGLNTAAYVAELMRTALDATDKGQVEAARTLGFSKWKAFYLITLPQALTIAKPVYQSTIINLIQWTSVLGYVSITDLTRVINNFSARTMKPMFMLIVGVILYLSVAYLVNGLFALHGLLAKKRRNKHEFN